MLYSLPNLLSVFSVPSVVKKTAFGLLAGLGSVVLAASRRRRRR